MQRLCVYPHAFERQNAFYSPVGKSLRFGYFNAKTTDPREELPGGRVFTCLSHDIIAHETTHAILDGSHRGLLGACNDDMLAFHEGFADIVAIFQHFTLPNVLRDQIQRTRGDLGSNNLLVGLASQFARATGAGKSLRNALGTIDANGVPRPPDPKLLALSIEPHARGAVLVAAVFDVFLKIYGYRVADLRRIATGGTGVLPQGDIHPDLANRFAAEAVQVSERILTMCIRAIDYLPPVDVTFGDYLRGILTADYEANANDDQHFRRAFIESFRNRGIYPHGVLDMAEDSLRWETCPEGTQLRDYLPHNAVLGTMTSALGSDSELAEFCESVWAHTKDADEDDGEPLSPKWNDEMFAAFLDAYWKVKERASKTEDPPHGRRFNRYLLTGAFGQFLWGWLLKRARDNQANLSHKNWTAQTNRIATKLGFDLLAVLQTNGERCKINVHAFRPAMRVDQSGRRRTDLMVIVTQNRNSPPDVKSENSSDNEMETIEMAGGCTLLIEAETGKNKYAIAKNSNDTTRERGIREFRRKRQDAG